MDEAVLGCPQRPDAHEASPPEAPGTRKPRRSAGRHLRGAASIALALAVAGGGAGAFALQARQSTAAPIAASRSAAPGEAALLPASTLLYASLNPKLGGAQGSSFQQMERMFTGQSGFSAAVAELTGQKSASCLNINRQVLSWVNGPITLAAINPSLINSKSSSATSGLAVLIAIKPGASLGGILAGNKLGTVKPAGSLSGVPYGKVQITACNTKPDTTPTFGAVVGHEAVLTPSLADLKAEINVLQGKAPALSGKASYRQLMGALPDTGFGYLYLDLPALIRAGSGTALNALGSAGTNPLGGSATTKGTVTDIAKEFGATGIAASAQANGLRLQGVQLMNVASSQSSMMVTPNKGATLLPSGTIFYLSLSNLSSVISAGLDTLTTASPSNKQTVAQLKVVFGNVLTLLNGEFALGVLPISPKDAASLAAGNIAGLPLAALINVASHPDAQTVLSTLFAALGGTSPELQFTTAKSPHGNTEYVNKSGYGYALIKGWIVASTSVKSVVSALEKVAYGGAPSMAAGSSYQMAAGSLAKHSAAVMFLDLTKLRQTLEGLMTGSAASNAQYARVRPLLVPFKALQAASSVENGGKTLRFDALLVIGK
jgi:hypothetical protein